jgi:hypothetical protein
MKPVFIHRLARAELDAAIEHYEREVKGLGLDLQSEVERTVQRIQRNPQMGPRFLDTELRE